MVRMPPRMRSRIASLARTNRRSMNSEIVFHLEKLIEAQTQAAPTGVPAPTEASPEA
ncbi:hypothetical protein MZTS_07400 [Methylorubrum zatmanii]|nr:hypothetical protein [Methylorubrum zatmanii]